MALFRVHFFMRFASRMAGFPAPGRARASGDVLINGGELYPSLIAQYADGDIVAMPMKR